MNANNNNDCHCSGTISQDCRKRPPDEISESYTKSSTQLSADKPQVSMRTLKSSSRKTQCESSLSADQLADSLSASLATIAAAGARMKIRSQSAHRRSSSHRDKVARGIKRKYSNADAIFGIQKDAVSSTGKHERMMVCRVSPPSEQVTSSSKSEAGGVDTFQLSAALHKRQTPHDAPPFKQGYRLDLDSDDRTQPVRCNHGLGEHAAVIANPPTSSRSQRTVDIDSLLPPFRDPCIHTIRKTFRKFVKRNVQRSSTELVGFDNEKSFCHKHKSTTFRNSLYTQDMISKSCSSVLGRSFVIADTIDDAGGSSGSGTEGGYAASSSSNGNEIRAGSCSSPSSEESSEDSCRDSKNRMKEKSLSSGDPNRPMLRRKHEFIHSASSDIADFSSSTSVVDSDSMETFEAQSESTSIASSSNCGENSDDDEHRENCFSYPAPRITLAEKECNRGKRSKQAWLSSTLAENEVIETPKRKSVFIVESMSLTRFNASEATIDGKSPILALGCDVMAHVLTFLQPPEILETLTMPLSKDWMNTFTRQPELWRVLCLLEPFKAYVDENNDSSDESDFPFNIDSNRKMIFGKFRLLYTSFVRCMRYLIRIKEDAINGRPPSVIDFGTLGGSYHNISANRNLQQFFSRARTAMDGDVNGFEQVAPPLVAARAAPVHLSDEENLAHRKSPTSLRKHPASPKSKVKFGHSKLTQRLLGPASNGQVREVELPWSCGIYSIVNWMVAFADVEGIQTMCLKVLPFLLENEQQRITAQRAGLTDIVLRAMVLFPESTQLHTAAFHTIVLLARPLGGQEGMLFHTSMVNSSGIFDSAGGSHGGKNGIAVLLDSMRRFQGDKQLQSMSCWSLVNIALAPAQKEVLVVLGGIEVTAQAMLQHPYDAEVQFRALFALINLVIPSVSINPTSRSETFRILNEVEQSENEMLDDMVNQIVHLVVLSMKNFCSNEAILNRACLVLHNLSLTPDYHEAILWTPNCYQMLEWCLANYQTDQVLQQSAAGTLHRLQTTLSRNDALRTRFAASLQAQQQLSLEQARAEAVLLHEHHG